LRFDVIQDLLDYVWVSDIGDDPHSVRIISSTRRMSGAFRYRLHQLDDEAGPVILQSGKMRFNYSQPSLMKIFGLSPL
jgi:hypothetical protein